MSTKKVPINKLAKTVDGIMLDYYQSFSAELTARVIDKVPVDGGSLKGSITLSKSRNEANSNIDKHGASTKAEAKHASKQIRLEESAYIVAGEDYAAFVEFGTDKMRPQPFMRPAVLETPLITKKVARDL